MQPFPALKLFQPPKINWDWSPFALKICWGNSSTESPRSWKHTAPSSWRNYIFRCFGGSWRSRDTQTSSWQEGIKTKEKQHCCYKTPAAFWEKQLNGEAAKGFLPTCNLIFYLPLHEQGLHVDGSVPNEAGTGDAPVRLAKPILLILIPEISQKHTKVTVKYWKQLRLFPSIQQDFEYLFVPINPLHLLGESGISA